jgi:hypothetical protein
MNATMSVFGIKFPSFEKASHRTPIRRALSAFASPNAAIFRRSLFPAKRFFIARRVPLTLDLAGLSENQFPAIAVSANAQGAASGNCTSCPSGVKQMAMATGLRAQILFRSFHGRTKMRSRMPRPARIVEYGARESDKIGINAIPKFASMGGVAFAAAAGARVLVFIGQGGEIRAPRHAGKLGRSWATRRHSTMPVTLLGAACRPSGDLTTKNNQSRYHENNY